MLQIKLNNVIITQSKHSVFSIFFPLNADRKLCKELCRLPILWIKPSERTTDYVHEIMSNTIGTSQVHFRV